MSYYIIIRGPLASGKTTITTKLARELDAEHIKIDDILREHKLDTVPAGEPNIPKEKFFRANKIILPHARKQLAKNKIIIFDACFYHKEVIEHLIANLQYPHRVFTLKVPLEICIERDRARSKSYGPDAVTAVHRFVSAFDYGTIIDGSGKEEETMARIISYLKI